MIPLYRRCCVPPLITAVLLPILLLLVSCGGSTVQTTSQKPTPTPTPGQGQQLLTKMAHTINTARSIHGIFNLNINGQALAGAVSSEIWDSSPDKSRTEIHQSSIAQISAGSVTVTDGKQLWEYDPVKNVVYNGPAPQVTGAASGSSLSGIGSGQGQSFLNIVQTIFTHSDGTLQSSSVNVEGHDTYDVHIVPQANSSAGFSYAGEMYIDKITLLPVKVVLNSGGIGAIVLDIPTFELNPTITDSTFTFVIPTGAKVLPLQQATASANPDALTLVQAQQQAGYHLLSIPGTQADYVLESVAVLGAPGSQTYSLHYFKGNLPFTVDEGKPLANLPAGNGQKVSLRGTSGTITGSGSSKTLIWTEEGVGIHITGDLSNDQLTSIAGLLS
jgi:outer membrane lipoprotein-sorting protein